MMVDWHTVEEAAQSLGVSPHALKKWRQRKIVPHKWRLPIIRHLGLEVDAFDELEEERAE